MALKLSNEKIIKEIAKSDGVPSMRLCVLLRMVVRRYLRRASWSGGNIFSNDTRVEYICFYMIYHEALTERDNPYAYYCGILNRTMRELAIIMRRKR